jgi:iduronate 2-sulfatase
LQYCDTWLRAAVNLRVLVWRAKNLSHKRVEPLALRVGSGAEWTGNCVDASFELKIFDYPDGNTTVMRSLALFSLTFLYSLTCWFAQASRAAETQRPNVLFIAVDDLRPALGCYGDPLANTPHIDRFAQRSVLFNRAYCQQAVCSPSRASIMTGLRPDDTGVWDLKAHFRAKVPNVVTLPQCFKQQGYHAESIGKIYHGSGPPARDAPSWSVAPRYDNVRDPKLRYATPENLAGSGLKRNSTESAEVPGDAYVDGIVCQDACRTLTQLAERDEPFFLAVGFRKPHLPFCAPRQYWDLYERTSFDDAPQPNYPHLAPELATRPWRELEGYSDIAEETPGELDRSQRLLLRHGYYACVSYVDALVGQLLQQLEHSGLANNTIIVLWSDHGFHLGELGLWTKCSNYELATRVPLIIHDPRNPKRRGVRQSIVELVDVFPTLTDLCDLDSPPNLAGESLAPLLNAESSPNNQAAYSQFPRAAVESRHRGRGHYMGYAVRSNHYRYVEWRETDSQKVVARELYDYHTLPIEVRNIAASPDAATTIEDLSRRLDEVFARAAQARRGDSRRLGADERQTRNGN